jgi:hypothetical protein
MAFFQKKPEKSRDVFWKEYEEKLGQKILGYGLGQYLDGWDEYDGPLWGLLIVAEDRFIFHHFAHEGWLDALTRITTGGEGPKEKVITLPVERLVSVELEKPRSWLARTFSPRVPRLIVRYKKEDDSEGAFVAETDMRGDEVAAALQNLINQTPDAWKLYARPPGARGA